MNQKKSKATLLFPRAVWQLSVYPTNDLRSGQDRVWKTWRIFLNLKLLIWGKKIH